MLTGSGKALCCSRLMNQVSQRRENRGTYTDYTHGILKPRKIAIGALIQVSHCVDPNVSNVHRKDKQYTKTCANWLAAG